MIEPDQWGKEQILKPALNLGSRGIDCSARVSQADMIVMDITEINGT